MKIYTRTGDRGKTSLFGGKRVSKASARVDAYGTVDELNSMIGVVIVQIENRKSKIVNLKKELEAIQHDLFAIGSYLASPGSKGAEERVKNLEVRVKEFEELIDEMTKKLPELRNFILPGGGKVGSELHVARTICRRVERRLVAFIKKEKVGDGVLMYFNRLSDLLFTMARFANMKEKKKETIWKKI
jgi:cob(I)alamin adenosyltransferase